MQATARDVLDFWFGAPGSPEHGQARSEWFQKNAAFDRQIAQRFGALIDALIAGAHMDWMGEARGALARIVVLDQFTRNAYRDTPGAFSGDALALAAARRVVARGHDLWLPPVQRVFLYLPFEHAEDLAAQRQSLQLMQRLAQDDASMLEYVGYARRHYDIVERFGRFPHRNAILGRISTHEEEQFLMQPGSRF
jgi:uncharacterized protein (DUF924 family)